MNANVSVVLYTSKTLSNGQHPLMLRLTKDSKRKYISLQLSLNAEHWDGQKCQPRKNCPNRDQICQVIQQKIAEYQHQVLEFKTDNRDYTLHTLIQKTENPITRQTFGDFLNCYIERLHNENRIGNARTFKALRSSLLSFHKTLDFYFVDIDHDFLRRYEQWQRSNLAADNSIGIRFRSLRVLYNEAIVQNVARKSSYPFDTYKVSQFREQTAKRAIAKDDIRRIESLDLFGFTKYPTPYMEIARDLFLFSYYTCGINLTDILHLRYDNIVDSRITFRRQKTGKLFLPTLLLAIS